MSVVGRSKHGGLWPISGPLRKRAGHGGHIGYTLISSWLCAFASRTLIWPRGKDVIILIKRAPPPPFCDSVSIVEGSGNIIGDAVDAVDRKSESK
jgi:hypothetical protein